MDDVDWIALRCVKLVREAKMRAEPRSKIYVRSFVYTMAHHFHNGIAMLLDAMQL